MTRRAALTVGGGIAILAVLQLAGPDRSNPATDRAAHLETHALIPPAAAGVLRRACYDCHSNDTRWPWYAHVAPVSWLVIGDVTSGRGQVNFSRWADYNPFDRADMLDAACRLASSREMPPRPYVAMHPEARLSDDDLATLCAWTRAEAEKTVKE